jgi:hypothetical protein
MNSLIYLRSDPEQQDQALFESRLMEDPLGVAIRKINHSGKTQQRYIKCIPLSSAPHLWSSLTAWNASLVASSTASSVLSRRKSKLLLLGKNKYILKQLSKKITNATIYSLPCYRRGARLYYWDRRTKLSLQMRNLLVFARVKLPNGLANSLLPRANCYPYSQIVEICSGYWGASNKKWQKKNLHKLFRDF